MFDWFFNLFKGSQRPANAPPQRPVTNLNLQGPAAPKVALPQNLQPKIQPGQAPTGRKVPLQEALKVLSQYAGEFTGGVGPMVKGFQENAARVPIRAAETLTGTNNYQPKNDIERLILGNEPVTNLQDYARETASGLGQIAGQHELGKNIPTWAALPAGMLLALGDVSNPAKGAGKKAADDIAKAAAKQSAKELTQEGAQTVAKHADELIPKAIPKGVIKDAAEAGAKRLTPKGAELSLEGADIGKKVRGFTKTVKASDEVSPEVKAAVNARYNPITKKGTLAAAEEFASDLPAAKTNILDTLSQPIKDITTQDRANAITVAKKLDAAGDHDAVGQIYTRLAEAGTTPGQQVWAYSLLNNLSPEGLQFRAIRDIKRGGGKITDEVKENISKLKDVIAKTDPDTDARGMAINEMSKYIAKQMPKSSLGNRVVDVWRAGLLTGPVTTTGNLAGNTTAALNKFAADPLAAMADRFQSIFTGQRTKTATLRGELSGLKEGLGRGKTYLKTGYDKRNVAQKYDIPTTNYGQSPLGKLFGNYTKAIYRYQGAQDQPFFYAALKNSLSDQALAAAKNQKLSGEARRAFIKEFVSNPAKQALEQASDDAARATFGNKTKLGEAAAGLQRALGPAGTFLVPFTRVPAAVAMRVIDSTPIGTAKEIVKQIVNVRRGGAYDQRAMSEAIGNGMIGPIAIAAGASLAKAGEITLGYPKDPKEQELWKQEGKQPYAVKIGDQWLSLNYIQPFGTLLAMGGQFADAAREGGNWWSNVASAAGVGGQSIINQSFLKGLSGTINAINDPQRYSEQFLEQTAGSVIPNAIRTVARATDPTQRQVEGAGAAIQAGIPGLRQGLPAKTDTFGNELEAPTDPVSGLSNPLRPSAEIATAGTVTTELRRLQDAGLGINPNNITGKALGDSVSLDDSQIDAITRYTGPRVEEALQGVIEDPRYQKLTPQQQQDVLKKANEDVMRAYKAEWGVDNSVIKEEDVTLTKAQQALLRNEKIDWIQKVLDKAAKGAKGTGKKKTGLGRGGSRGSSGSRKGAQSAGKLRLGTVSNGKARAALASLASRRSSSPPRKIQFAPPPSNKVASTKKIKAPSLA